MSELHWKISDPARGKKVNKFLVVVPFYNVEEWIEKCINSIKGQNYDNFSCILIDDISTDSSYEKCIRAVADDNKFTVVKNKEKKYALKNIIEGINILNPQDEDVIMTVDGDDWVYDSDVFKKVDDKYREAKCLITYGNYERFPDGQLGHCSKYSNGIINNNAFRQDMWRASHLRTFKYKLWKNIKDKDLLDNDGNYLDVAWDLAFMFPMLEMAGERQECFSEPLYVYNMDNPNNDFKLKLEKQRMYDRMIRHRPRYERIE